MVVGYCKASSNLSAHQGGTPSGNTQSARSKVHTSATTDPATNTQPTTSKHIPDRTRIHQIQHSPRQSRCVPVILASRRPCQIPQRRHELRVDELLSSSRITRQQTKHTRHERGADTRSPVRHARVHEVENRRVCKDEILLCPRAVGEVAEEVGGLKAGMR